MRRFDDTELWEVLNTYNDSPAIATVKLDDILDGFLAEIHSYCREDRNIAERTRSLNYLRSKLTAYLEDRAYTSKKFTVLRIIIKRAISSIDSELMIIKMDLEHPERFIEFPADPAPLARWGGSINDLIEYHLGPQAAGVLQLPSGRPMNYEESIEFLEKTYGISVPQPHDRRGRVLDRQKNTAFTDEMRRTLLEEAKKRDK